MVQFRVASQNLSFTRAPGLLLWAVAGCLLWNFASAQTPGPGDPLNKYWPISRHDTGHTGFNSETVLAPPLKLYGQTTPFELDALVFSEILIDELGFYLKGYTDIIAFDALHHDLEGAGPFTPEARWRLSDWEDGSWLMFYDSVAICGGRLVIRATYWDWENFLPYTVLSVRARSDGRELWGKSFPGDSSEMMVEDDSKVWFIRRDISQSPEKSYLTAYSVFSGAEVVASREIDWEFNNPNPVIANGRLFRVNTDNVVAHSTATGEELWRYVAEDIYKSADLDLMAVGEYVIGNQRNRLFVLNAADKSLRWSKDASEGVDPCGSVIETFAATDGVSVAITGVCDDDIVVYDVQTGEEKWRKSVGFFFNIYNVLIADNLLYVFNLPNNINFTVRVFNLADGSEIDDFGVSNISSIGAMAASEGHLYLHTNIANKAVINLYEREPANLSLSMNKFAGGCGGAVGGTLKYEFEVTNNGPGASRDTQVTITTAANVVNVSSSHGSCDGASPLTCALGTLGAGESATIVVELNPTAAGTLATTAQIVGDVRDTNPNDNVVYDSVDITPAPTAAFDLAVTGMEVTQVIQNLNNDVPLISRKATLVRVVVQTNEDVSNVQAVLRGFRNGFELMESPLSPLDNCIDLAAAGPGRSQMGGTFNFLLPLGWNTGELTLTAEVNRGPAIPEADLTNNIDAEVVTFIETPPICIVSYPVETSDSANNTLVPNPAIPETIIRRAVALLPIYQIRNYPKNSSLAEWGFGDYEMDEDGWGILAKLWLRDQFSDDPDNCDDQNARTLYLGFVDRNTAASFNGLARTGGDQLIVRMETGSAGAQAFNDPLGGRILAHEIAHNYGRKHVGCGNCGQFPTGLDNAYPYNTCVFSPGGAAGYVGADLFDFRNIAVVAPVGGANPNAIGDLLSYNCDRWPSDYTYRAIFDRLQCQVNPLPCLLPTPIAEQPGAASGPMLLGSSEVLLAGGLITTTGSAVLEFLYRTPQGMVPASKLDRMESARIKNLQTPGDYAIVLLDGMDAVLHSEPFEPEPIPDYPTEDLIFTVGLPFNAAAAKVRIVHLGATLLEAPVSANAPTVSITKPAAGSQVTQTLTVQWTAEDLDGDDLQYMIQYSNDNGLTWEVLAEGVLDTTFEMDAGLLAGSYGASLVRVTANDGVNTGSDTSDPFSVALHSPLMRIDQPASGAVYALGEPIVLMTAQAYDPEDGPLLDAALRWSVGGLGEVGQGWDVFLTGLPAGEHTITLQATDSDAQTASDEVTIRVESFLMGDIVQDGQVNQADVDALIDHILGRAILTGASLQNADYNGDLSVDVGDVIAIIGPRP